MKKRIFWWMTIGLSLSPVAVASTGTGEIKTNQDGRKIQCSRLTGKTESLFSNSGVRSSTRSSGNTNATTAK